MPAPRRPWGRRARASQVPPPRVRPPRRLPRPGGRRRAGDGHRPLTEDQVIAMLPESGRGLAIMRACVDDVTLSTDPGVGTVVSLEKRMAWRDDALLGRPAEFPLTDDESCGKASSGTSADARWPGPQGNLQADIPATCCEDAHDSPSGRRHLPRLARRPRRRARGGRGPAASRCRSGTARPDLRGVDAVILPGGFSYGDYLRCGAIARFAPVMAELIARGPRRACRCSASATASRSCARRTCCPAR